MNKLIELLNEYEEEKTDLKFKPKFWEIYRGHLSFLEYSDKYSELLCISKRYEFIKRLVDNDKIDLLRLDNRIALSEFNKVERCLMALSIQDNPIEFLISILK